MSIQQVADSITIAAPNPATPDDRREEFSRQWISVRPQVLALCRRSIREGADADDLFGRVALRAWRGFGSFRGDASFLTWVVAIARREIARTHARHEARSERETSLEEVAQSHPERLPTHPAPAEPASSGSLKDVVRRAASSEEISRAEADVVLARIQNPGLNWSDLGKQLGLDGTTCAVTHCRAVPKLRVFLFVRHPDFLGGAWAVEEAFAAAQNDAREPLSMNESQTFRALVIERTRFNKPGWKGALRTACGKVIKHLPMPS